MARSDPKEMLRKVILVRDGETVYKARIEDVMLVDGRPIFLARPVVGGIAKWVKKREDANQQGISEAEKKRRKSRAIVKVLKEEAEREPREAESYHESTKCSEEQGIKIPTIQFHKYNALFLGKSEKTSSLDMAEELTFIFNERGG